MNKNTLVAIIFVVSISLSLVVGYIVGTKNATPKTSANKIIATYTVGGAKKSIELKDVTEKLATDFADYDRMVYQQKRQAVMDIIGEEVRKNNDFTKMDLAPVSPEDFDKMLTSLKLDKKKLTEKQRMDITGNLAIAQRNQKIKSVVEEKQKEMNVQFLMEPPFAFVKRQEAGPLMISGSSKNPIEFIYYGNMHCPQCAQAFQNIQAYESQYPGQLKVYFKYLGLEPDQSIAFKTAKSLYCLPEKQKSAGLVGQLMKAYFAKPPESDESLSKIMSENGVNPTDMEKCLNSKENNAMLRTDALAGQDLNRNIAVFYVINNYFVHGAEQKVFIEDLIKYLVLKK